MASITADDLARRFLTEVGADPNNAGLRRAVRVWKSSEGQSICGNNPWFIRYTTYNKNRDGTTAARLCVNKATRACSTTGSGSGYDCNFSQFRTLDDGIHATSVVLHNGRYAGVLSALRGGDALGFLHALGQSGWAAGGYNNALIGRFRNVVNGYNWTLPIVAVDGGGSSDPGPPINPQGGVGDQGYLPAGGKLVGAWGNLIIFPDGHILTVQDVDKIMATLSAAKNPDGSPAFFTHDPVGAQAAAVTRGILISHIGQPWNKPLEDTLQAEFYSAANNANPANLPVLRFLGSLINVLNVETIGYTLALVVGGGLALYGFGHIAGIQGPRIGLPSPGSVEL